VLRVYDIFRPSLSHKFSIIIKVCPYFNENSDIYYTYFYYHSLSTSLHRFEWERVVYFCALLFKVLLMQNADPI